MTTQTSKKLTKKQQLEKENLEWFCQSMFNQFSSQEGEYEEYLGHCERGIPVKGFPRKTKLPATEREAYYNQYFNIYVEAKKRRGQIIHEVWEQDFFSGRSFNLVEMLQEDDGTPIPEHIKDYLSREIFRGQSKDLINELYAKSKI